MMLSLVFFFSSRRRHTRFDCDWSSDVCSSDLAAKPGLVTSGFYSCSRNPIFLALLSIVAGYRSEERRVGKECRTRWWPDLSTKKRSASWMKDSEDGNDRVILVIPKVRLSLTHA